MKIKEQFISEKRNTKNVRYHVLLLSNSKILPKESGKSDVSLI